MESPQSSSAAVMTITSFCGPKSGSSLSSIASKPLTETSSATPERSQRRRLRTPTNIYSLAWYLYPDRNNDPQQWENHFAAPKNNIKYTAEESGFATRYPDHPDASTQHFFFTMPKQHGIEPFWPHLLAGASSVRFHRPDSGLGINDKALACLKAARLLEQYVPHWNVEPANEFLSNQADDEAYLAATKKHDAFAVYFPASDSLDKVTLDLSNIPGEFTIHWINIDNGKRTTTTVITGGKAIELTPPGLGNFAATISSIYQNRHPKPRGHARLQ